MGATPCFKNESKEGGGVYWYHCLKQNLHVSSSFFSYFYNFLTVSFSKSVPERDMHALYLNHSRSVLILLL